ncbi:MAG: Ig-like domain-containing protein [Pseudomonadota bacterium]
MSPTRNRNRRRPLVLATLLAFAGTAAAEIEDNPGFAAEIEGWTAFLLFNIPPSLAPGPLGIPFDLASIATDIRLKYLPAEFVAPQPAAQFPTEAGECFFETTIPQVESQYQNLLGFFDFDADSNWGALGTPTAGHGNSQVKLRVRNPILDAQWASNATTVQFPSGNHRLRWEAATQLDKTFDVIIPTILFLVTTELKYGKAITSTDPGSTKRAIAVGKELLRNLFLEVAETGAGALLDGDAIDAASHVQNRTLIVYDVNPPVIENTGPTFTFEALDFGGLNSAGIVDELRAQIVASDPCGLTPLVGNDIPFRFPIGTNTVTWTASDSGPRPPDGRNPGEDSVTQTVIIEDTKEPILLTPPNRVIESAAPPTPEQVDIGTAVVFDLADPDPLLENTAPVTFPVDARQQVLWTATDASGNSASASQWITVKTPGTNTPPSVNNVSGATLTSQPVDLTLTGSDNDLLSGAFDPLNFDVLVPPANGFFVAPLVPYFIEDYRVRPGDRAGDILNSSSNPASDLFAEFCSNNEDIPIDFVYQPEFVVVTDEGINFVLDRYWACNASDAGTRPRISKWDPTGQFLAQKTDIDNSIPRITLDRDGFLYIVSPQTSSSDLSLRKFDQDFNDLDFWRLEPPTNQSPSVASGRLYHARLDSDTGIIYATDRMGVFAYDGADGQQEPAFLGGLKDNDLFMAGDTVLGRSNAGYTVEVDSAGFVYVLDSGNDRIHQFGPAMRDGSTVTLGNYVGYLGRCESGPNCDDENQRSIGYSCTETTCTDLIANGSNCGTFISGPCTFGSGQGQFNVPSGMALDDEDILYVTDYNNSRVQRFTNIGDFAGEAGSTCDGTCFVLGDMGRPEDISVNADNFYVLDRDRSLMHVFETAPFKEITENSVVVTYASDNSFQGIDTFTFRAGDGLAFSNTGTATIEVSRAFRPPEAFNSAVNVPEDGQGTAALSATDPDGILGVDFNGLDTLTYEVVEAPQFGELSGELPNPTYTPMPDYNGPDRFTFRASDGRDFSNIAEVLVTVAPVNDIPVVRFTSQESKLFPEKLRKMMVGKTIGVDMDAGLGFPVPLFVEFDDPDAGERHSAVINWGDGTSDSALPVVPDEDDPPAPVITPTFNTLGQLLGEHTFLTEGAFSVEVCVFDVANAQECRDASINILPMIDLALADLTDRDAPQASPGSSSTVLVEFENAEPQSPVSGLTATNVQFTIELPTGVTVDNLTTELGSCATVEPLITCSVSSMAPGDKSLVTLTVTTAPEFDSEATPLSVDIVASEREAGESNRFKLPLPVLPQQVFADSFE